MSAATAPRTPLFYHALGLSGGWDMVDRVARRHGELVVVCGASRCVSKVIAVRPAAAPGFGGLSHTYCRGCFRALGFKAAMMQREDREQLEEGNG